MDEQGRSLLMPLAERDLCWTPESCREDAEGEHYVLPDGGSPWVAGRRYRPERRYMRGGRTHA